MSTQHTAGPWAVGGTTRYIHSVEDIDNGKRAELICDIVAHRPGRADNRPFADEMLANARLIASAPDLLAALRPLVAIVNGATVHKDKRQIYLESARAAIAKATGHE